MMYYIMAYGLYNYTWGKLDSEKIEVEREREYYNGLWHGPWASIATTRQMIQI